jgi:hypothetical protein
MDRLIGRETGCEGKELMACKELEEEKKGEG